MFNFLIRFITLVFKYLMHFIHKKNRNKEFIMHFIQQKYLKKLNAFIWELHNKDYIRL